MWRGGGRLGISVSAPFVWRCLTGAAVAPFPHPAHRTGRADFPHPALGQELTPSPAESCEGGRTSGSGRIRHAASRQGIVSFRVFAVWPSLEATGGADAALVGQWPDRPG